MLLGASERDTASIANYLKSPGAKGPCTIVGSRVKTNPVQATFANAFLSQVHDSNDGNSVWGKKGGDVHPGRHVFPAVLAAAEAAGKTISGKELITAIVIGYEVSARIQSRGRPGYKFHTFAPAARLLGLTRDQLNSALVIAGYLSIDFVRMTENKLCIDDYALGNGYATAAGVEATLLAKAGFKTQPATNKDNAAVFFDTQTLGETFSLLDVYTKPWPTCRDTHSAIEAVLKIKAKKGFSANEVASIYIQQHPRGMYTAFPLKYEHRSRPYLNGNLYYLCSCAAMFGQITAKELHSPRMNDKKIYQYSKRIKIDSWEDPSQTEAEKAMDHRPVRVTIQFKNGTKESLTVSKPRGHPQNPESKEEALKKFMEWSSGCSSRSRALDIAGTVEKLEDVKDVRILTRLLST